MWVQSLGWEDPLEEGMATQSSVFAQRIPWTEEPGGSQRVGHDWSDSAIPKNALCCLFLNFMKYVPFGVWLLSTICFMRFTMLLHSHCSWVFCAFILPLMTASGFLVGAILNSATINSLMCPSCCLHAWYFQGTLQEMDLQGCKLGTFSTLLNDPKVFHSAGPSPSPVAV